MATPTRHELARSDDNSEIAVFTSGAGTYNGSRNTTHNSRDLKNYGANGVVVFTDVTAVSGGAGWNMTVGIEGKDSTSGKYYNVLSGATISAAGTQILKVYPYPLSGASVTTRAVDVMPRTWRVRVEHSPSEGASGATYTVGATPVL